MPIGIYWIYQISRDRAIYVGSSKDTAERIKAHISALNSGKHFNPRLLYTWRKYGAQDFSFKVLEECALDKLIEREQFWMDTLSPVCNVSIASDNPMRGQRMSEEHKKKLSDANKGQVSWAKGKKQNPEHTRKASAAKIGKNRSPDTIEKMRRSALGRTPWNKGKKASAEAREKMSIAKKGKPPHNKGVKYSQEIRDRMAASQRGKVESEEHKRKISEGLRLAYKTGKRKRSKRS